MTNLVDSTLRWIRSVNRGGKQIRYSDPRGPFTDRERYICHVKGNFLNCEFLTNLQIIFLNSVGTQKVCLQSITLFTCTGCEGTDEPELNLKITLLFQTGFIVFHYSFSIVKNFEFAGNLYRPSLGLQSSPKLADLSDSNVSTTSTDALHFANSAPISLKFHLEDGW